ncbi:multiheme c-type cytochrome [Rubripirellula reticaptiva]|uniref:Perchlorate reductase subunit gamma n=1 Tax=Rubripirellula reticaptiva TaxID=2528013 RepID=A0A5C6END5_9BACT|nr:multiheme c-type cytochrome [Rubripirellula reticaptiva]TWU49607.1 Perchlorate reductase subunit gamma precursor [Rubripirellula reticaptiva]
MFEMKFWSSNSTLAGERGSVDSDACGRRQISECRRRWLRRLIATQMLGLGSAAVIGLAGCAPPAPVAEKQMSVGMPTGQSSDPGVLTQTEIQPPPLVGVDRTTAKTVSMRFSPAPDVSTDASEIGARVDVAPEISAKSMTETLESIESIGVADSVGQDAYQDFVLAVQRPKPIAKPVGPPELIPTPVGEPDPKMAKPESPSVEPAAEPIAAPAVPGMKPAEPNVDPNSKQGGSGNPAAPMASVAGNSPVINSKSDPTVSPAIADPKSAGESIGIDGPEDYKTWQQPTVALVFTGQQHGYIEPCGCTGLDRQKGGVARRYTFIDSLAKQGWNLVPMDAGNQVRRFGKQAAIKMQQSARALDEMGYQAVGFGPDDIRLGVGDLLALAAEKEMFVSANVVLFDPEYLPVIKMVEKNGIKIGATSILDPDSMEVAPDDAMQVGDPAETLAAAAKKLAAESPDFSVLLFFGKEENARALVRKVPGFDLVVAAGGYGEPTYQAESIEGSDTRIIVTGDKGMYAGLVGLYSDGPMKYARVPLTHEYADAPEMRAVMKDYQNQLRDLGLGGLGLLPPIKHSSDQKFIGSQACGKCHTNAFDIWESSAHAEATEHLVHPPKERSDISRHFDPECISCHVTGWNPQDNYPYETGYLSLELSPHLTGNGCENCHGPGSGHAAAEQEGADVTIALRDELRDSMKLPLEKAREKCMTCHDLDNSPDFHAPDAFEDVYWPEVEHYGVD